MEYFAGRNVIYKFLFIISVIIFRISLDLGYFYFVFPNFGYAGFNFYFDSFKLVESYFLMIFVVFCLPYFFSKPSDFLLVYFVLRFIPTFSIYSFNSYDRHFLYIMCLGIFLVIISRYIPFPSIPKTKSIRKVTIILSFFMTILAAFNMVLSGGVLNFNLDFSLVYEFRRDTAELINKGIMGYLNIWAYNVFNIFLIAFALLYKRYFLFVFFIIIQIFFYGITNHKSPLFYPLIIIGLTFFKKNRNFSLLTCVLILITIFSLLLYLWIGNILVPSLFIRRVFFVPAQLNFMYYEFFEKYGHVYMSNSVLSNIFDYPFVEGPTKMISEYMKGDFDTNCNNGFIATSYMHFGINGVVAFSIIVGLLMKIVDRLEVKDKPLWFTLAITIIPFQALLTSADLSTSLLTHGILISFLILWCFNLPEKSFPRGCCRAYRSPHDLRSPTI